MSHALPDTYKNTLNYTFPANSTNIYIVPPGNGNPDGIEDGSKFHPYTDIQTAIDNKPAYDAADLTTWTVNFWLDEGVYDPGAGIDLVITGDGNQFITLNCNGLAYYGEESWFYTWAATLGGPPPPPPAYACGLRLDPDPVSLVGPRVLIHPTKENTPNPIERDTTDFILGLYNGSFMLTGHLGLDLGNIATAAPPGMFFRMKNIGLINPTPADSTVRTGALSQANLDCSFDGLLYGIFDFGANLSFARLRLAQGVNIGDISCAAAGFHELVIDTCSLNGVDIIWPHAEFTARDSYLRTTTITTDLMRGRNCTITDTGLGAPLTFTFGQTSEFIECEITSDTHPQFNFPPGPVIVMLEVDGVTNYKSDWTDLPDPGYLQVMT